MQQYHSHRAIVCPVHWVCSPSRGIVAILLDRTMLFLSGVSLSRTGRIYNNLFDTIKNKTRICQLWYISDMYMASVYFSVLTEKFNLVLSDLVRPKMTAKT